MPEKIDLNQFVEWAKQNPSTRTVDIHINSSTRSDFITVWVYDKALQAGQHVKSVEEINLEDKKSRQERLEYERLKAKFEPELKAVS